MTYEEFCNYAEYVVNHEVPEELLDELNGGVLVNEELKEDVEESNFVILGQYIRDNLGSRVVLYYGTFWKFYKNKSEKTWQKEISKVIKHELRHHIEARAGQEDLAKLERWEKEQRRKKNR
ncbi:MAG: metallopeptidase family protein [Lachnospiraceae bacterium]